MSWKEGTIKDISNGFYDGPHATPKPSEFGPIFLGIRNITDDGRLTFSEVRHISIEEYPKWTKRVTPKYKDIVFSYEATLNRYAIIPEGFLGCLGRRMALIRPNLTKVNHRFLYYYFFSTAWRKEISNHVITGATVDRIPLTNFLDFKILIPSLPTQQKIASILSAYDDLIENNLKRIKLLEEAAQNIYKEWFVNFRFPEYENAKFGEDGLPEGWEMKKIKDFGLVVTGKTPSTKKSSFYNGKVFFVKTPDMHNNTFVTQTGIMLSEDGAESQKNKTLPPLTVLVSCIGTAGVVSLTSEYSQTNQQINAVIVDTDSKSYFFYFFAKDLKEILEGLGSSGATFTNVNKNKFENIKLIFPKELILENYGEIVRPIFDNILNLLYQNQTLKEARDILLPRLMDRRIEV